MGEEEDRTFIAAEERQIARGYEESVEWLASRNSVAEIAALIEQGRLSEILTDADIARAGGKVAAHVVETYRDAARRVAAELTSTLAQPVSFDGGHDRAVRWIRARTFDVVREVSFETRAVIRQAISDGLRAGMNPRAHARLIRGSIGLTEYQHAQVARYRQALLDGDAKALRFELRDRRFDAVTRAAVGRAKQPLTDEQVSRMVERYQHRFVAFRAETIARSEAQASVFAGQDEMWTQAVDGGDVDPQELEQIWRHSRTRKHSRDGHVRMSGQRRPLGVPFTNPLTGARLRFPADPQAPASERLRCACLRIVRFRRPGAPPPGA